MGEGIMGEGIMGEGIMGGSTMGGGSKGVGGDFLLAVVTKPEVYPGELVLLEALLEAGVERLHLRKPGGSVEELLERLAPRWASKLVVHGSAELATRYGVMQIHGAVKAGGNGIALSTSVHSWDEFRRLPQGLAYALISPLFDSISKPGYRATDDLLTVPPGPLVCRPVGMGGVSDETIGLMMVRGWTGAAVLGWIWEEPGAAVSRFEQLKKIIDGQAKGAGSGGI
jgi:thiamine monophosphate synthase